MTLQNSCPPLIEDLKISVPLAWLIHGFILFFYSTILDPLKNILSILFIIFISIAALSQLLQIEAIFHIASAFSLSTLDFISVLLIISVTIFTSLTFNIERSNLDIKSRRISTVLRKIVNRNNLYYENLTSTQEQMKADLSAYMFRFSEASRQ